jgi:hypothetical protein
VAVGSNPDEGGIVLGSLPSSPPTIAGTLTTGVLAEPYSQQLTVSGGAAAYTWSIATGQLPAGLSIDPSSGLVSGTPTALGTQDFTVAVRDSSGNVGAQHMDITVKATTTTNVSATPSSTAFGGSVTFSATVTAPSGTPTGTVTFSTGSTTLCTTAALSGGTASCSANTGPTGSDTVKGTYSGDLTHLASSGTTSLTVVPATTTVSLVAQHQTPLTAGEFVDLVATISVSTPGSGTPTGTVAFTDAGTDISGCGAVVVGTAGSPHTAVCATHFDVSGSTGALEATYSGDSNFETSASQSFSLQVDPARSITSASAGPDNVTVGTPVTYSATVSGNVGSPSGTVTFTDGATPLCSFTLSGGGGSCSSANAPPGSSQTVTATYSGSSEYAGSSGTTTLTVTRAHGYWLVGSDGGIFTFGSAKFFGSTGNLRLNRPVVGITPTADHGGYWLDASDGGVFSFGDTNFYGSIPGLGLAPAGSGSPHSLNAPIVGMVPSFDDGGYFMVASDGGVFAFGDAHFAGSCPGIGGCSGAAVSVMPDGTGNGYWLVTKSGNVYTFGDAGFYGAPGRGTVTSAVATPDGMGYWILLGDGEVFGYGDASNSFGSPSTANFGALDPANAIFSTLEGGGYWVASALGKIFNFGDAPNDGDMSGTPLNGSIIAGTGF